MQYTIKENDALIEIKYRSVNNLNLKFPISELAIRYYKRSERIQLDFDLREEIDLATDKSVRGLTITYMFMNNYPAHEYLHKLQKHGIKLSDHPPLVKIADHCKYEFWLLGSMLKNAREKRSAKLLI